MSRSYKKTPVCCSSNKNYRKCMKKTANKKVRKSLEVYNGNSYRKVFQSGEIFDFYSYKTLNSFMESSKFKNSHLLKFYKSNEELTNLWSNCYYRK